MYIYILAYMYLYIYKYERTHIRTYACMYMYIPLNTYAIQPSIYKYMNIFLTTTGSLTRNAYLLNYQTYFL